MNEIPEMIKKLRKSKGWTQQELANKAGLSKQSILNYEKGKADPTGATLGKLADVFGCSVDYICGLTIPDRERATDNQGKLYLIESLLEEDPVTINRMIKYYELLKKGNDQSRA